MLKPIDIVLAHSRAIIDDVASNEVPLDRLLGDDVFVEVDGELILFKHMDAENLAKHDREWLLETLYALAARSRHEPCLVCQPPEQSKQLRIRVCPECGEAI